MRKRFLPSGVTLILAAPVMAAALVGLALALRPWEERLLVEHWQEKIDALADEDVWVVCRQLAGSGETGIRVLAGQLGSDRNAVSQAVHDALRIAIDEWQEDSAHDAFARLALVARVLTQSAASYHPTARSRAADIAHQILLCLPDGDAADRFALVTDCRQILSLVEAGSEQLAAARGHRGTPANGPTFGSAWSRVNTAAQASGPSVVDRHVRRADHVGPGAGPDSVRVARPLPPLADHSGVDGVATESSEVGAAAATGALRQAPPGLVGETPKLLVEPADVQPIPSYPDRTASRPGIALGPGSTGGAATTPIGSGQPTAGPDGGLDGLPAIDVMRLLHDAAPETADAAEAELFDRGLTATQVRLARQLTDPDPSVRSRLIDLLPELPGCDSRPWLYWLSADEHADVRLAALTVMATSGDPDLLRRVETIARSDRDPRIAVLAERIREDQR